MGGSNAGTSVEVIVELIGRLVGAGLGGALLAAIVGRLAKGRIGRWAIAGFVAGIGIAVLRHLGEAHYPFDQEAQTMFEGCMRGTTMSTGPRPVSSAQAEVYCGCVADKIQANYQNLRGIMERIAQDNPGIVESGRMTEILAADDRLVMALNDCTIQVAMPGCIADMERYDPAADAQEACWCYYTELSELEGGLVRFALRMGNATEEEVLSDPSVIAAAEACRAR